MLHLPVLRWGEPYTSMDVDEVTHFGTGEPIARVSRANGGLIQRDMRKAARARERLRQVSIDELIARVGRAGELYMNATLPMGDGTQSPDEFVRAQSASTGLPERMARAAHDVQVIHVHLNDQGGLVIQHGPESQPAAPGALWQLRTATLRLTPQEARDLQRDLEAVIAMYSGREEGQRVGLRVDLLDLN